MQNKVNMCIHLLDRNDNQHKQVLDQAILFHQMQ